MKTLATAAAVVAALGAIASQSPAMAAMGQCFDAYGRPYGPPHNTDNPPYGMICQAYRVGGHCTHVQPGWAESNCGVGPSYYRSHNYDYSPPRYYRYSDHDYDRRYYYNRGATPQERQKQRQLRRDPNLKFEPAHPDPTHPPIPDRGPPNSAR